MRGIRICCAKPTASCSVLRHVYLSPPLTSVILCYCHSWALECGCVLVFSIEFVGRVLSCPNLHKFAGDFLNWIDLMAIVPFYIEEAVQSVRIALARSLSTSIFLPTCSFKL